MRSWFDMCKLRSSNGEHGTLIFQVFGVFCFFFWSKSVLLYEIVVYSGVVYNQRFK